MPAQAHAMPVPVPPQSVRVEEGGAAVRIGPVCYRLIASMAAGQPRAIGEVVAAVWGEGGACLATVRTAVFRTNETLEALGLSRRLVIDGDVIQWA